MSRVLESTAAQERRAAIDEQLRVADEIFGELEEDEIRWRDRQQFLHSCGYMLRPRYRPGWTPSWAGTGKHPTLFEDSISLPARQHLIDATRISDGILVYLKRVQTGDNESRIATMLSRPPLRDDPRNHCVPILDVFQDAEEPSISYMVMPFLRLIDDPPFETIEEIVDFANQILEGLVFIHEQSIAHRDCTYKNLMMDATAMYPQGFHPVWELFLPDAKTPAKPLRRTNVAVKYYYVDFGISVVIPSDRGSKVVLGDAGRDQEVPELSSSVPYDPFKVDIFIIGNLFRRYFHDKLSNVDFLVPLISSMTHRNPDSRPSAVEALAQWRGISESLSGIKRRWRLKSRDSSYAAQMIADVTSSLAIPGYLSSRLVSWIVDLQG